MQSVTPNRRKKLSDTRWSARYDDVHALSKGYDIHINLLNEITTSVDSRAEVKSQSLGISKRLKELETGTLVEFWDILLEQMNKMSKLLQSEGLPLNNAVNLLQSLSSFIESQRDRFDHFEEIGKKKSGTTHRNEEPRVRQRKRFFDEVEVDDEETDTALSFGDSFKINTFLPIIDRLVIELASRLEAYKILSDKFGFILKLVELTPGELRNAARNLVQCYPDDLEDELESEIVHFAALIQSLIDANVFEVTHTFET